MTIPEACSLVLEAGTMGRGGEIFVFDMGEPVKIIDLANKMIKLAGLTPVKDIRIDFTGLRPGEKLYEELLNKNEEVMPTHHKKIMIAKVNNQGSENIFANIHYLIELAKKNKNISVVKQMKAIVAEYKSKNSTYEKLDLHEPTIP
jgi:FlaA1/EpsC-like NDP-sugar epimerase